MAGTISGILEVVEAFVWREVVEGDPDRVPKGVDGSARHFAQGVFEFGEDLFDWIEVGL